MVDIQSTAAEIRRGKKEEDRNGLKPINLEMNWQRVKEGLLPK